MILHTHWRDMLCAISFQGTFWLRGSDCEVYRFQPEVIDLTQDGDGDDDADLHAQANCPLKVAGTGFPTSGKIVPRNLGSTTLPLLYHNALHINDCCVRPLVHK